MDETLTGVLVNKIYPDSPAKGILKSGDIILSVDGQGVENDGTIELRKGERTSWRYSIQKKHINKVRLDILRARQIMDIELELSPPVICRELVPEQYDVVPTYYIVGGLVFEPLTVNYLQVWGKQWRVKAPTNLLNYHLYGEPTDNRRQVVVLVRVLADEINTGYYDFENRVVSRVNGREIANMRDLVDAIEEHEGMYHVIIDERGYKIVLDKNKVIANGHKILEKYNILSDRSKDLERSQQKYVSEVH
jgi:hypothetical protein